MPWVDKKSGVPNNNTFTKAKVRRELDNKISSKESKNIWLKNWPPPNNTLLEDIEIVKIIKLFIEFTIFSLIPSPIARFLRSNQHSLLSSSYFLY